MRLNSIYMRLCPMLIGLTGLLLGLFTYIAYIDMKLLMEVFVTQTVTDSSLFDAAISDQANIDKALSTITGWLLLDLAVGLIIAAVVALLLARSFTKPIKETVAFANRIASGDLSQQIAHQRKDELGMLLTSLNTMSNDMSKLIKSVKSSAVDVSASTTNIVTANQSLTSFLRHQVDTIRQDIENSMAEVDNVINTSSRLDTQTKALMQSILRFNL